MKHSLSLDDQKFRQEFEACNCAPAEFNHGAHVRLAYVYLSENDADTAHRLMRDALLSFIRHHGVAESKYHETITRAWIMAVRHFMAITRTAASFDDFIAKSQALLDTKIMLTHYSAEVLFSAEARTLFVKPDLDPIPGYDS